MDRILHKEKGASESFPCADPEKAKGHCIMKAKELDELFDAGEDITKHLDLTSKKRPGLKQRRVNVDFPEWMIETLDQEATKIGITRQSIIKIWIADRIKAETRESG